MGREFKDLINLEDLTVYNDGIQDWVDDKLKNVPGVITSATEPTTSNNGDFWYQTY